MAALASPARVTCPGCGAEIEVGLRTIQVTRVTSVVAIDTDVIRAHIATACPMSAMILAEADARAALTDGS